MKPTAKTLLSLVVALHVSALAAALAANAAQPVRSLHVDAGRLVLVLDSGQECTLPDGNYGRKEDGSGKPLKKASRAFVGISFSDSQVQSAQGFSISGGPGDIPVENISVDDAGVLTLHLEGDRESNLPDGWYHPHKHGSPFRVENHRIKEIDRCTPR